MPVVHKPGNGGAPKSSAPLVRSWWTLATQVTISAHAVVRSGSVLTMYRRLAQALTLEDVRLSTAQRQLRRAGWGAPSANGSASDGRRWQPIRVPTSESCGAPKAVCLYSTWGHRKRCYSVMDTTRHARTPFEFDKSPASPSRATRRSGLAPVPRAAQRFACPVEGAKLADPA